MTMIITNSICGEIINDSSQGKSGCESLLSPSETRKELRALIGNWKLFKHDTNLLLLDQQRNFSSLSS